MCTAWNSRLERKLTFVITWIKLNDVIMLSERTQSQKEILHDSCYMTCEVRHPKAGQTSGTVVKAPLQWRPLVLEHLL